MGLLWHCCGIALGLLITVVGLLLGLLWDCRGNALGLLLDYREVATYLYEIAMGFLLDITVGCGIAVG